MRKGSITVRNPQVETIGVTTVKASGTRVCRNPQVEISALVVAKSKRTSRNPKVS